LSAGVWFAASSARLGTLVQLYHLNSEIVVGKMMQMHAFSELWSSEAWLRLSISGSTAAAEHGRDRSGSEHGSREYLINYAWFSWVAKVKIFSLSLHHINFCTHT
jgi:hypothetical protein